jgi:hypothetical protein
MPLPPDGEPDSDAELPALPDAAEPGAELWQDLLERWIGSSAPPLGETEAPAEPLQPPPPPSDDIWG